MCPASRIIAAATTMAATATVTTAAAVIVWTISIQPMSAESTGRPSCPQRAVTRHFDSASRTVHPMREPALRMHVVPDSTRSAGSGRGRSTAATPTRVCSHSISDGSSWLDLQPPSTPCRAASIQRGSRRRETVFASSRIRNWSRTLPRQGSAIRSVAPTLPRSTPYLLCARPDDPWRSSLNATPTGIERGRRPAILRPAPRRSGAGVVGCAVVGRQARSKPSLIVVTWMLGPPARNRGCRVPVRVASTPVAIQARDRVLRPSRENERAREFR